jgi:hypothetical protein
VSNGIAFGAVVHQRLIDVGLAEPRNQLLCDPELGDADGRPPPRSRAYEAFSIAIAATFWVGVVGAVIAVIAVAFMREEPMRTTFDFAETADAAEPVTA